MEEKTMDNYKTIETKLANREPFRGNSLTGYILGGIYYVDSYSTQIARVNINGASPWISPTKFSVTTSRQQNLIKRAWAI